MIVVMAKRRSKAAQSTRQCIIAAMRRQGITSSELADTAGLSRSIVSRYLRDEIDTTTERADAMLRVLGLQIRPYLDE